MKQYPVSRRDFLRLGALTTTGLAAAAAAGCQQQPKPGPSSRQRGQVTLDVASQHPEYES